MPELKQRKNYSPNWMTKTAAQNQDIYIERIVLNRVYHHKKLLPGIIRNALSARI